MSTAEPLTLAASLVLGLGGSLHCFAMCGPLACVAQGRAEAGVLGRASAYHAARVVAYGVTGALLGTFGRAARGALALPIERALPWVMAGALLVTALGRPLRLGGLPTPRWVAHGLRRLGQAGAAISPIARAGLLGALTPLLPCGLLYAVGLSAITAGTPSGGAAIMACFALGALPALVAAQLSLRWLGARGPSQAGLLLRALPVISALVLILRAGLAALQRPCH